jgi:hypothetical protein
MPTRRPKMKKVDKKMDQIRAEFMKTHVIMKKQKQSIAKSRSCGRFVATLKPTSWFTAVATFLIYALPRDSGKAKKVLRQLLETMEPDGDVSPLLEPLMDRHNLLIEKRGFEPPMDSEELALVWEELMMEVEHLDDAEVVSSYLTVKALNESVKALQKKELSVKEQKRLRFYTFLKKFEEKLLTMNISGDAEIWRFLDIMISKVANISIKNRKEKRDEKQ